MKIKKKLREDAVGESLIPKKESDFYHDHIDVIMRENYVSSDSEEEELARRIKTARLNTARATTGREGTAGSRLDTGLSRHTGGTDESNVSASLKLPAINN